MKRTFSDVLLDIEDGVEFYDRAVLNLQLCSPNQDREFLETSVDERLKDLGRLLLDWLGPYARKRRAEIRNSTNKVMSA